MLLSTIYWLILNYSVCSKVKKRTYTPVSTTQITMACAQSSAFVAVLPPDLGSLWALLPGQHFCVTPESAPTQESDTCMGVAVASPPACWSMRQFPASGARRGRAGEPALLLSLILSGKSNGPLQQQPLQTNRVWLWSCFLMHYNHSE